jgi:hypothetical protein
MLWLVEDDCTDAEGAPSWGLQSGLDLYLRVLDAHFNSFEKKVLPVLTENGIGVLGMKPMGDHVILESKTVTPTECLYYSMNLPTSVVITGCDSMPILQQGLDAARSFQPMDPSHVAALLAKTSKAASSSFTRRVTSLTARTPIHSG